MIVILNADPIALPSRPVPVMRTFRDTTLPKVTHYAFADRRLTLHFRTNAYDPRRLLHLESATLFNYRDSRFFKFVSFATPSSGVQGNEDVFKAK